MEEGRATTPRQAGYQGFFFPLDGVGDWNRLYGPKGLFQHQSVVPEDAARGPCRRCSTAARRAGQGSFLTVLKRFGSVRSPALLSFPRPGYTLTLDFPNRGAGRLRCLPNSTASRSRPAARSIPTRMRAWALATFAASFPEWQRLEAVRDPAFMSELLGADGRQNWICGRSGAEAAE